MFYISIILFLAELPVSPDIFTADGKIWALVAALMAAIVAMWLDGKSDKKKYLIVIESYTKSSTEWSIEVREWRKDNTKFKEDLLQIPQLYLKEMESLDKKHGEIMIAEKKRIDILHQIEKNTHPDKLHCKYPKQ